MTDNSDNPNTMSTAANGLGPNHHYHNHQEVPSSPSTVSRIDTRPTSTEESDSESWDENNNGEGGVFHSAVSSARSSQRPEEPSSTTEKLSPSLRKRSTQQQRLLHRNEPHYQSSNALPIRNTGVSKYEYMLFRKDWFHVMLRLPSLLSITVLLSLWTAVILIFAGVYMALDSSNPGVDCGLGEEGEPIHFGASFAFSLETCTTVGYGLPGSTNAFFENCPSVQVAIYMQMVFSMMFNAFLFAFFFARLSRCESRSYQVLFGDKAIVRWEEGGGKKGRKGRWVMEVRVYDADCSRPLVEAHVRLYAIQHPTKSDRGNNGKRRQRQYVDMPFEPMRITSPNDDLGGMIFPSVPSVVTHHMDMFSPLVPPRWRRAENNNNGSLEEFEMHPSGLILREVDSFTGNRDGLVCTVCGESYGTLERLKNHIKVSALMEAHDNAPVEGTHQELDVDALFGKNDECLPIPNAKETALQDAYDELKHHLIENNIEIMCVVEAIEPMISGTFQALQSYTVNDLVFGGTFAPCVLTPDYDYVDAAVEDKGWRGRMMCRGGAGGVGGVVKVDLDRFHAIVD